MTQLKKQLRAKFNMNTINHIYLKSIYGKTQVFRDVSSVFSVEHTLKYFLKVEGNLAKIQGELNIIPKKSADEIHRVTTTDFINKTDYFNKTAIVGFPIVALVEQLSKASGIHGRYVHWGATTQDIMDTALMLQIKVVLEYFETELESIVVDLLALIKKYRKTIMVGRSQLQHALPITFGFKAALWLSPILEHLTQLRILRENALYVQFGGAVGTLASLDDGIKIRKLLAKELGLKDPVISWHSSRETLVEIMHRMTAISGSLGKIGKDLSLMSHTEIHEVQEQKMAGRGISSTMPQKKNPISAQGLIVSAKNTAKSMNLMYEALLNDHERGTGIWQLEWATIPDLVTHTAGGIGIAKELFKYLEVYPEKMKENLMVTNGFIMAESVMMQLAKDIGKQKSHDIVHELIERANIESKTFEEIIKQDKIISKYSESEINAWLNPLNYLGDTQIMIDSILQKANNITSKKS